MKKRICIFQMHFTDITKHLIEYNAVEKIVRSNIFDDIVIAAADIKENQCLIEWAQRWGVKIRFGSITNVTSRFSTIVNEFSANTILRLLPQWYFIDTYLIKKMVNCLEENEADYISLPRDFDIRFGGDMFSKHLIDTLNKRFNENKIIRNIYKFNPWGYVDLLEFNL